MTNSVTIALIGDYCESVIAHQAIPRALSIAGHENQLNVEYKWLNTVELDSDVGQRLSGFQGIWCVPASPYENMAGALAAIRYAREQQVAFLGTCGGYQHAILEFARNVLNLTAADNAEVNPNTEFPLISQLVCSLVEVNGTIHLLENTRVSDIYKKSQTSEAYHCSFGINRDYLELFSDTPLTISGVDDEGDPRCFELDGHPYFIGTAYQPERSALTDKNHPLINQFILAASVNSND